MEKNEPRSFPPSPDRESPFRWSWIIGIVCLSVLALAVLMLRVGRRPANNVASAQPTAKALRPNLVPAERTWLPQHRSGSESASSAEEIVAAKMSEFARGRLGLTRAMGAKFKIAVPPELEQFFAAAEAGRWEDVKALFAAMREGRSTNEGLNRLWGPILETYGTAQIAHEWPAQKLLDYGQAVLGSLRSGMVYSGGTDPGRFIPTLLNETSDGDRHIVLAQNALADNSYREYFDFLYHDRLGTLSEDDSQRAFSEYMADAQKRLAHDQQFPNEPKQVRPGEDIQVIDGRVQVSGQVAVMAINERLFRTLMDKNPDLSFAMEESFPFQSMYSDAAPLGPIMELRAVPSQNAYTAEMASQAVDYWQTMAQEVIADSNADSDVRKAYSKMASAQAGLLADHNLNTEADQAYRIATEICPTSPEAVFRYVNLLVTQNRLQDALQVAQTAMSGAPDNLQFQGLVESLQRSANRNR